MVDTSKPQSNKVALVGFVSALVLFSLIIAALYILPFVINQELHEKVDLAPTTSLDSLRADENIKLNQPGYVDRPAGIVRIPISLALRLEAQHPWRENLPVPAHTFPTSATLTAAPTPPPGGGQ
jgi:hypothetical protein